MKTLVAFGDSWVYGDELLDPTVPDLKWCTDPRNDNYRQSNGFPGLIAKHFGWSLENHASNGQSLQSMIWTFQWWVDTNPDFSESVVLVGLTHPSRHSWWFSDRVRQPWDPAWYRYLHSLWLESANGRDYNGWYDFHRFWRAKATDDEWTRKNYQTAVYFFSGFCHQHEIPLIMFNVFEDMPDIPNSSVINGKSGLFNLLRDTSPPTKNPDGVWGESHPNKDGHRIIAEYLINHIKPCKLARC
jgi:hypothetical protein